MRTRLSLEVGPSAYGTTSFPLPSQAELFGDRTTLASILAALDPRAIKALGREVSPFDQHTWEKARYAIVLQVGVGPCCASHLPSVAVPPAALQLMPPA